MTTDCAVLPAPGTQYFIGGQPVLTAFYTDPVTGLPVNPTSISVKVRKPDGTSQTYTTVSSPAVTSPTVGTWEIVLPAVDQAGDWFFLFDDDLGGDTQGRFHVQGSAFVATSAPTAGRWISATELFTDNRLDDTQLPPGVTLDNCVEAATDLLVRWSGGRYPKVRTDVIRPYRPSGCGGWDECWCGSGEVLLPPGSTVLDVKVDGVVLASTAYHLYDGHRLVRQDGRLWPCNQSLSTPLGQVGSWSVTVTHGPLPPRVGLLACRELSIWIAQSFSNKPSRIPNRATKASRGGIDVPIARRRKADGTYTTDIPIVDDFLNAVNPHGLIRRSKVSSPDVLGNART
ncbi:MAG TPA: hypothetical protein VF244_01605 [Acidimicrobiales bacterium]